MGEPVRDEDAHLSGSGGVLISGHNTKGPAANRSSVATMSAIYPGTDAATRRLTASTAGARSPRLPSTTPKMMIAPPAQLQLTSGLTKTRNAAHPSGLEPPSPTSLSAHTLVLMPPSATTS